MELPTNLLIICFITLFMLAKPVISEFHFASEFCRDQVGNYTVNSKYQDNLNVLLTSLTNQASLSLFNNDTVGQGTDQTYGIYLCRGDLDVQECQDCVSAASTIILEKCPVQKEAIVWYYECLVRYANHYIFSLFEQAPFVYFSSAANISNPETFDQIFSQTMNSSIMQAAYDTSGSGYATGETNVTLFETVYVVAQCSPDIVGSRCERCLRVALRSMGGCCGGEKIGLAMFLPSCWLQYDQTPIIGEFGSTTPVTPSSPFIPSDTFPPSDSNSSSLLPPRLSPGSSTAATITSGGLNFLFGILMAVSMSSIMPWRNV